MAQLTCEKCRREIRYDPVIKTVKSKQKTYCSEHCFLLDFYNLPFSYESLRKCYEYFCLRFKAPEFRELDKRVEKLFSAEQK